MSTDTQLGDADEMFRRYFERWYDDNARAIKWSEASRPDMIQVPEFVGRSVSEISPLDENMASKIVDQVDAMREAALEDWPKYLSVEAPVSLAWIEAFDAHFDLHRVEELQSKSDPDEFSNEYLINVCEFGAVLGSVMIEKLPRLSWLAWWPYWESAIFDQKTGAVIPVFHWAIKKYSTYGVEDGFSKKLQQCVKMLRDSP